MADVTNMAVFCDFENIAIGCREAKFDPFDIQLVIERLLDKGKIVVKKAYSNWDRFKSHKRPMHEAAFELIEIPHVSYSGKNSADIRMVVDALDLCYTKSHVETFVILSGDSDFSPLVSKLRENDKQVIGVGVKHTSSDLLIENCDDYIYYDELVRTKAKARKSERRPKKPNVVKTEDEKGGLGNKEEAISMLLDLVEALFQERDGNLWGSMVKQTLKRKRPNFSESYYGYRSFGQLLEDCQTKGLLVIQREEKSGGHIIVGFGPKA